MVRLSDFEYSKGLKYLTVALVIVTTWSTVDYGSFLDAVGSLHSHVVTYT